MVMPKCDGDKNWQIPTGGSKVGRPTNHRCRVGKNDEVAEDHLVRSNSQRLEGKVDCGESCYCASATKTRPLGCQHE